MEIHLDKKLLKEKEFNMDILLAQISTGKAILFTGAGFSKNTTNIKSEEPPLSWQLAENICRLGGFDEDKDLRYAADYFLSTNSKSKLISLLKESFSLTDVSDDHINICKVNWKRCYTTNYDKSIEIASGKAGKVIECVDLNFRTDEYYKREALCIHLNGSIDSLTNESLEKGFKLSTSSYISADSFITSDWLVHFRRDLDRSSAIIFVGYSMYDIEVQKILVENGILKEKTYFITATDIDPKSKFTLSKFGRVLPIGVNGFSTLIHENSEIFKNEKSEYNMRSISLYEVSDDLQEIRDSHVETMLMYGDIDKKFIDSAVVGTQRIPYLILRHELKRVFDFTQQKQNTFIFSELGNGKSIFLSELKTYFSVNSTEEVYEITDIDTDYIEDIDILAKSNKSVVIFLDGYEHYLDLLIHYCSSLPKNISIIASSRTAEHEKQRPKLKEMGLSFNEVNIDFLIDDEPSKFIKIIDNVGLWGSQAGLSPEKKISFLKHGNNLQISLALLALFDAPQIKNRIGSLLTSLIKKDGYKDTIFAIALLDILDLPANFSLISDVARNCDIYNSDLCQNESFKQLFKLSGNKVISKSSVFCLSLIRNHFSASYIVNQLQKIAQRFNEYTHKDFVQNKIFKSMLKFSFVENLLPETNRKNSLKNYYEDLKISVPWLKDDPHFWLQYGMAYITFKEYQKAQGFFDQAYSLAKNKINYHTNNIDAQQARLFILVAINENNHLIIYDHFDKAHKLLDKLENDIYKFRQVEKYRDFFESCYTKLSKKNQINFEHVCKKINLDIEKAEAKGEIDSHQHKTIGKAKENISFILTSINKEKITRR